MEVSVVEVSMEVVEEKVVLCQLASVPTYEPEVVTVVALDVRDVSAKHLASSVVVA